MAIRGQRLGSIHGVQKSGTIASSTRVCSSAAFSSDGRLVVTVSLDQTARLWEAETGGEITVRRGHQGEVFSAAFAPDGRLVVTASRDGTVRLWDVETGREVALLRGHAREVWKRSVLRRTGSTW
jgi:WD40 repeat protein